MNSISFILIFILLLLFIYFLIFIFSLLILEVLHALIVEEMVQNHMRI